MYYLDSNAFIYPALEDGEKAANAAALLRAITDGTERGATAGLTLDEVIRILSQNTSRETAVEQGRRVPEFPNLEVLGVGGVELLRAIAYRERYERLAPRDAINPAVAVEHGVDSIVSDDEDFDSIDDIERIGLAELDLVDTGSSE